MIVSMFDLKEQEKNVLEELYAQPTKNYWVTVKYFSNITPTSIQSFHYAQFDYAPFFPRVNRFYEWLIIKMKDHTFVDYEVTEYHGPIFKYSENIDTEYTIH
tara:strand:- start:510 stop:815 length:306 start_codon:yes stop_codon:yes gene_type:complete